MVAQPRRPRRCSAGCLASEIPSGARWCEFDPTVGPGPWSARREARAVLGIAPQVLPRTAVDALFATSHALGVGDGAAARRVPAPTAYRVCPACHSYPPRTRRAAALPQSWAVWTGGGGDGAGAGLNQRCRPTRPEGIPRR